jgi:hypothetical protein
MTADRKPILILKRTDEIGGTHKIEVFNPYSHVVVIHRHSLVEHEKLSKLLGFKRLFYGKYYCMQEIVIFESEASQIIKSLNSDFKLI